MDLRECPSADGERHPWETVQSAGLINIAIRFAVRSLWRTANERVIPRQTFNSEIILEVLENIEDRIPDFSVWTNCHVNPVVATQ